MVEWFADTATASMDALIEAFRALVLPAIFFAVLALLVKRKTIWRDLRRVLPETSLNIQIMVFNVVFVVPVIAVCSTLLTEFVRDNGLGLVPASFWDGVPLPLTLLVAVFVGDFVGYWRHRLEHTRLLWPSHAVHHSDTEMTWLALERFHPINRFTTFAIDSAGLLLLAMPPFAILANLLVRHYYGYFIHADLPWTYGRLGAVFVSPAMHRWHHAADVRAFNTNYATVFSFIDRWFGTCRVPGPCTTPLGVTDKMEQSLYGQLSYPFLGRGYRGLFSRRRRRQAAE